MSRKTTNGYSYLRQQNLKLPTALQKVGQTVVRSITQFGHSAGFVLINLKYLMQGGVPRVGEAADCRLH